MREAFDPCTVQDFSTGLIGSDAELAFDAHGVVVVFNSTAGNGDGIIGKEMVDDFVAILDDPAEVVFNDAVVFHDSAVVVGDAAVDFVIIDRAIIGDILSDVFAVSFTLSYAAAGGGEDGVQVNLEGGFIIATGALSALNIHGSAVFNINY